MGNVVAVFPLHQKQPPDVLCQKDVRKIHRETPVPESLFK